MEIPSAYTFNFTGVISESKRIILTRFIHVITFSLLFLPLSFSLIITPTLNRRLSDQPFTYDKTSNDHQKLLTSYLLYTLIVHVIALCAISTITYITHHAFFGQPVNFIDSLKSLIFSFVPIALTAIAAYVLIILITMGFLLLFVTVLILSNYVGFGIAYNSVYFVWFSAIMAAILIAIIVYFYVSWSLAFVVVVVESKWGFSPLMRSSYLVKGMRLVSFLVMICFGGFGAVVVAICSSSVNVVVVTVVGSVFLMMLLLGITCANTVLYNYCKALHGELAIEGFVNEYTSLPSDGEKVSDVVVGGVAV